MKFGLMIVQNTDNIGDDIQSYAALRFLPHVDYYIDRERLDAFCGDNDNWKVAVIMNAWYMYTKFNWPPSPYIHPLFIAMHISKEDYYDIGTRFLDGLGGEYLKKYAPIGARDQSTYELCMEKGIESYISGCLTLTLERYANIEKKDVIYLVDLNECQIKRIKEYFPDENFEEVSHSVQYTEDTDYEERMRKVEGLLKKYQGAKCVITSRLHCALPCLALETPVLLVYRDEFKDRMEYYLRFIYNVTADDIEDNNIDFDLSNPPRNKDDYLMLRQSIIEKCKKFVSECKDKKIECEEINFYNLLEWQDNLINSAEMRYRKEILDYANWCSELQEGKNWLENENKILKEEYEKLNNWCEEQKQGRDWLENENKNLKEQYEKLNNWCEEQKRGKDWLESECENLRKWCDKLQKDKDWLENELKNKHKNMRI